MRSMVAFMNFVVSSSLISSPCWRRWAIPSILKPPIELNIINRMTTLAVELPM